jgi:hypothetical protein
MKDNSGCKKGCECIPGGLAIVFENLEELSVSVFSYNAELSFGLEILDHLYDVGVREVGQDANLLPQAFQILFRLTVFRNELHGHSFGGALAPAFENFAERALADLFKNVVILHGGWLAVITLRMGDAGDLKGGWALVSALVFEFDRRLEARRRKGRRRSRGRACRA